MIIIIIIIIVIIIIIIIVVVVVVVVVVLNTLIYTWTKVGIKKNKSVRAEMKIKYKGIKLKN